MLDRAEGPRAGVKNLKKWREGQDNLSAVRAWFESHLCGTQVECARALGLSAMAVNRHAKKIREEWREKKRKRRSK